MFKEYLLRSWKTTATGIVTGLITFLVNYGVELTPEAQTKLTELVIAAGVMLIGIFSKDGNVSGQA